MPFVHVPVCSARSRRCGNDPSIVNTVGKHLTPDGLRDIIHTERMIGLSFEGQSFYDICRWKRW